MAWPNLKKGTMWYPSALAPEKMQQFTGFWSAFGGLMFAWGMLRQYLPVHLLERSAVRFLRRVFRRLARLLDPHLTVTVAEFDGVEHMKRGNVYEQANAYLGHRCASRARSLRAERARKGDRFLLFLGDEEISDEFCGATVLWKAVPPTRQGHQAAAGYYPMWNGGGEGAADDAGRAYRLVFHERHRDLVVDQYLPHVCRQGSALMVANRRWKLYTNAGCRKSPWSHIVLEHPSTFATLAMDPAKKREIIDDLDAFRKGKDYYARIGKAWKRGYLLYGPPGTGKSTMIAAMANHLDYDVYDIELTSVSSNTELRRLFIDTKAKSIIVIEDIDCSLNLTGSRAAGAEPGAKATSSGKEQQLAEPSAFGKVTLSGLLNFIDGLWSACGGERVIVFTTNHVERLDPALIRRGRMYKHIEMSYCCFEAFKFLAGNYLAVDAHPLFDDISSLLQEVGITPADVAELLTPKRAGDGADSCLAALVEALEKAKAEKEPAKDAPEDAAEVVEDA